jgi:hypothetical protein
MINNTSYEHQTFLNWFQAMTAEHRKSAGELPALIPIATLINLRDNN